MKLELLPFLMYLLSIFFKQGGHDAKDGATLTNKQDLFKNYFLETLLFVRVLSALKNFGAFSEKAD